MKLKTVLWRSVATQILSFFVAGAASAQTTDVVQTWSADIARVTEEKVNAAIRAEIAYKRLAEVPRNAILPADWPDAYAGVLQRRAETLALFDDVPKSSVADLFSRKSAFSGKFDQSSGSPLHDLVRRTIQAQGLPEQLFAVLWLRVALIPSRFRPRVRGAFGSSCQRRLGTSDCEWMPSWTNALIRCDQQWRRSRI